MTTTTTELRRACHLTDEEFLRVYNNTELDNAAMVAELNTDFANVGVKLRSLRVLLHTTLIRKGGVKGTSIAVDPLELEARIWLKDGTIQTQPKGGSYMSLGERLRKGLITIDDDLNVTTVVMVGETTSAAPTVTAPIGAETAESDEAYPEKVDIAEELGARAPSASGTAEAIDTEFAFTANIFGSAYRLSGPDKDDALHALFTKLREMNFSKVMITNATNNQVVGINDIENGGSYKLARQPTAAS